jgi:hypothetical protein
MRLPLFLRSAPVGRSDRAFFFRFIIAETLSRRKSNSVFFRLFSQKCDRAGSHLQGGYILKKNLRKKEEKFLVKSGRLW